MIKLDHTLVNNTVKLARTTRRRRINHNFHREMSDGIQRLLNAVEPGSYIRPHKHENPDKREIFLILTGRMLVLEFDETGGIADYIILDSATGSYGAEIAARQYHVIIALEPGSVVYELKDGPYDPTDDKNFAPWAPAEGDPECNTYMASVLRSLGLPVPW